MQNETDPTAPKTLEADLDNTEAALPPEAEEILVYARKAAEVETVNPDLVFKALVQERFGGMNWG